MKKLHNKYITKFLIVILIVFLVDFISGIVLENLYRNCKSGICYQENFIMNKTNQDLLIFGSSRAAYHYVPSILSDTLGISVYNCGREGSGIYYHYGVLLSTLKRYTPKVIVLDIDYRDLYKAEGIFGIEILKEHAPFYRKISPEFDSLLVLSGKKEMIKLQSNLYRYNSKAFKIITGNLNNSRDNVLGLRVKTGIWKKKIAPFESIKLNVDSNKIATLKKFIDKAKENNIRLIFAVSPYYMTTPEGLYNPLESIVKATDVRVINHLQDQRLLGNSTLFNDKLHLNKSGAILYSSIVADEISYILNE